MAAVTFSRATRPMTSSPCLTHTLRVVGIRQSARLIQSTCIQERPCTTIFDHLADDGIVNIEDPIAQPAREPPIWKLLYTMRQVLLERGNADPEEHFFVFQWRTNSNNYYQILMKKTPFTEEEIAALMLWLDDVDHVAEIGEASGQRVGPITTATTTVLHRPGQSIASNVSRIVRGEADEHFLQAHNLQVVTDNRPFLFDVDPARPMLRRAYTTTLADWCCCWFPFSCFC